MAFVYLLNLTLRNLNRSKDTEQKMDHQKKKKFVAPQDGKFDHLPDWVETYGKLGLVLCVSDADQVPSAAASPPVAEGCNKAELLRKALVEDSSETRQHYSVPKANSLNTVGCFHSYRVGMTKLAIESIR